MINCEHLNFDAIALKDSDRIAIGGHGKTVSNHPSATQWGNGIAVVVIAMHGVLAVGHIKTIDNIGDALRTIHRQWTGIVLRHPAQHRQFAQTINMIGVKVGEQ